MMVQLAFVAIVLAFICVVDNTSPQWWRARFQAMRKGCDQAFYWQCH
jgi:hypothetical protein